MTRLSADIVIIGTGAAGGVLAATLAEQTNKTIVLLEKGGFYNRGFFNQREWDMRVLYADKGTRSTADGAIPVRGGECVGGGTTVNYALCFDPVRPVWEGWKRTFGLEGFSFDEAASDYGIPGLNLARCTRDVRRRANVHAPEDAEINDNNRLFEAGCRNLGLPVNRFELNMRDCLGSGFCAEGCAYDRKLGTMLTYLPDALKRGVRLVHHCDVEQIEFQGSGDRLRAVGVRARVRSTRHGSEPNSLPAGPLRVGAKVVLVCAGAIETPVLLQRSGHPDPHGVLGRGLILHPSLPIVGVMDHEISNYRGITGAFYSDAFYESHGFYFECLFSHPVYGAALLPGIGSEHFELLLAYRRLSGFGVLLVDTPDPANRVEWDPIADRRLIRYRLSEADKARLRFAAARGIEISFAAGATEVLLTSQEPVGPLAAPRFREPGEARYCAELRFSPHETTLGSAHCQATVKMGADARLSAVNARGESHFVRNLLVCDSSVFPASCGANPMISVMSLARYQGFRIAGELARYES